jgi:hypothetical protein
MNKSHGKYPLIRSSQALPSALQGEAAESVIGRSAATWRSRGARLFRNVLCLHLQNDALSTSVHVQFGPEQEARVTHVHRDP